MEERLRCSRILESLVLHPSLFREIVEFMSPDDIIRCISVNKLFKASFTEDWIWRIQCNRLGYSNFGTKSRSILYISVYRAHQCIECYRSSSVLLNIAFVVQKPALCADCFTTIMSMKWGDRLKHGLKRIKSDIFNYWSPFRHQIFNAIPDGQKMRGTKRPATTDVDFDGAFQNDYMVKKLACSMRRRHQNQK